MATCPVSSASSRRRASRRSAASPASESPGWLAVRAAAMLSARGSRAHNWISSSAAPGSSATSCGPRRRASSSRASASVSTSRASGDAPSAATRLVSWLRLVTMTRQPGLAGSSGRTCSTSRALSSSTSIRRPARRLRYKPACASSPAGTRAAGTDSASRRSRRASSGSHRRTGRVETAQVHVQLPIRELPGGLVREMQGQRGLADPGRPGDDRDDRGRAPLGGLGRQSGELLQRPVPAGEMPRRGGQLPGHHLPWCRRAGALGGGRAGRGRWGPDGSAPAGSRSSLSAPRMR